MHENTQPAKAQAAARRMRMWLISLLLAVHFSGLRADETPANIVEHTRSVYAALTSYSDTGAVERDYTATSHDTFSFTTHFTRAPRHFRFDFNKPTGDRIVVWGDPDGFHAWWKTTGQVTEFPNPKNTGALTLNDFPTSGSIMKISPLLYSKAGLPGAFAHFEPTRMAGMEDVGRSKCYRLEGTASDYYGDTGKKVNVRTLTVWIDSTSYLVRKVVEEAPAATGMLNRTITTFDPQPNPTIHDDVFTFAPPK